VRWLELPYILLCGFFFILMMLYGFSFSFLPLLSFFGRGVTDPNIRLLRRVLVFFLGFWDGFYEEAGR